MKTYNTSKIKNIALLGHAGSGKTTMAEAMLFEAGAITRLGSVEEKNTISDYHELERERGNSIFSTLMNVVWKDTKINMIDTPGYDDFVGEVISALRVADTGVVVLNAQNGVEVGTETIWEYAKEFETPAIFVVNQVDNEKADFDSTVEQAKNRFGDNVTVVQYPYNQGNDFNAIIDVLKMVMYKFPEGGSKPEKLPIPDEEKDKANELHNELIEAIAVNDEGLMDLYFEKGELTEEEMTKGMKASMIALDIFPLFCCSSKRNMGTGRVMGFVRDIAPSAAEMPPVARQSGKTLSCDPNGPTCLFIYKTSIEANLGSVAFFKIYSGTLSSGKDLVNSESRYSERISQIYALNGRNRKQIEELKAGDIGATVKLKGTETNSTLHEKAHPYNITPIQFPEPRINVAVESDKKAELAQALNQIRSEDPTIVVENSQELKQMLLSGQGTLHLAMIKWKVNKLHKLDIEYSKPRVPFRETIRKAVRSMYRHKKQSGGSGEFGEVHMYVEPYTEGMPNPPGIDMRRKPEIVDLDWGGKLVFQNCIVGGSIDAKYMSAIMKGIMEKMEDGPLTGSYVRDVRVCIYDGKMHPVDSKDIAFKNAASRAFKKAFEDAKPLLLEPIYDVEVMLPEASMGDIMSDLQTRRAIIMGMEAAGHYQKIKARIPLMELYRYSSTLRSLSQGGAKHKQRFAEYASVPADVQQKLIDEHKQQLQEV